MMKTRLTSTRSGLLRGPMLTLALLVFAVCANAQTVSTYTATQSSGTYTGITGGTSLSSSFDNNMYTVNMPTAFWFAGNYYTTMYVSASGFLTFGSAPSTTEYNPISGTGGYAGAISAFGIDIRTPTSGSPNIRWQEIGNEIIVQYRDVRRDAGSSAERITFQIRLNTSTGVINFVYDAPINAQSSTSSPQVGLRGPNNTFSTNVKNRLVNTTVGSNTWATSIAGTANNSTCRFTTGTTPASGQTYTFTPPCAPPTDPDAGADQTICISPGTATMAANTAITGTGTWTQVSGTAATITSPNSPTTTITGLTTTGARTFRWTIVNGTCVAPGDDVVVTVNAAPSTANAGPPQSICASVGSATMNATAPTIGTGAWTQVGGPSASITTPSSRTTTITGMTTPGAYTFRWTVSNAPCAPSTSDVVITADPFVPNYAVFNGVSYAEGFESWSSLCSTNDIPGPAWNNLPASGNSSWRRHDQGATASWTTATSGLYSPVSSQGSYSARFHSQGGATTGILDLYIDMSASPGLAQLTFDHQNSGGSDVLALSISTNGGSSFSSLGANLTTGSWAVRTFSITSTSPTTVIRFQATGNGSTSDIGIDDLQLVAACSGTPSAGVIGGTSPICTGTGTTLTLTGHSTGLGLSTAWSYGTTSGGPYPTAAGSGNSIATGNLTATRYYVATTICSVGGSAQSAEFEVLVNPNPTAANAGPPQTICADGTATLAANVPANGTGSWSILAGSPSTSTLQLSSTTANDAVFTPSTSGEYTLRWTIANAPCANSTNDVVITVDPLPSNVTANASAPSVCSNSNTVDLTSSATSNTTAEQVIMSQGWNSGAGGWTTTNTSSGGTTANAAWTIRANGYTYSSNTFNSNDNSAFFLTNSDAQGSGSTTATTLVSPAFSTVGYSAASLSFFHHYRYNSGTTDRAHVEVSTNGTTWSNLTTYSSTQGAVNGFVQETLNLNSVVGQATVYIRFRYAATWDWWWAVDNVTITGTAPAPASYSWSSSPAGFSSGDQNPTGVAVNQATTYIVTAMNSAGCTAQASVAVGHVVAPNAGSNNTLTICSLDAPVDMGALLGVHDAGAWSGPSAVAGDQYDPVMMDGGIYTYTVSGTAPCLDAMASVTVTENTATLWYADLDGDGFGDTNSSVLACDAPVNHVANNTDLCPGDGNKQAPGQCGCGNPDTDTDNDGTADCNDGCPSDPNKVAPGQCGCGVADTDSDNDGIADCNDVCPNVANGNPGDACDDGNAFTFNDQLGASPNCGCAGTPCTESVTIEFATDGGGLRWSLRSSANNAVVQGSPGYPAFYNPPASPNYIETTCLPNGSFYLVVEDQDCDGILNGGYILRVSGKRVIDNRNNINDGCPSQIAGNMGVNVPVGNDRLITGSCDRLDLRRGATGSCSDKLTADNTPNGTSGNAYQFWFYEPNGGASFVYPSVNSAGPNQVNLFSLPALQNNVLYNVRVRTQVSPGVWRAWGSACRMRIDNVVGQCSRTALIDDPGNTNVSCGKLIALPGENQGNGQLNMVVAKPVSRFNNNCVSVNANKYQFRFRIVAENVVIVRNGVGPNYFTYMTAAAGFQPCRPYEVEVRASFDGGATWRAGGDPFTDLSPWGDVCTVYTGGCFNSGGTQHISMDNNVRPSVPELRMYPNPNRGDRLFLSLTDVEEGVTTVSVDIHDLFGKRVSSRTIAVNDGSINTVLELHGEQVPGMYLVSISAGEAVHTERLIIQP